MFYIFFLENFIDGIIPPITPKKPLYKGGYGRGEGVPTPYRGVYGGSDHYIRVPPPILIIILHPHGITYYYKCKNTDNKQGESFKWIVHVMGVFNCGTNIWQHIHTAKKKGNYCSPSIVSDSIMKSSSSVGPLSVSEGEEQELPHCSHLQSQLQLYVLCVVVFVHPINKRDVKIVNKMFLILYKYIWWLILFAISLCWCSKLFYKV
jgi:hypothetical protein